MTAVIDVASLCATWEEVCPAAEDLARAAARLALSRGKAGTSIMRGTAIELAISLADDAVQQRLNRDWRGVDQPTNVLAFPAWNPDTPIPPGAPVLLGDVVLAFETAARESDEQGKPLSDHLSHLVVHGVLHLLGYDHATEAEAVAMESLEASILASLGVPNPYRGTM